MSCSTLLLRLSAPMQSWGVESKFNTRRTRREPSKSGVIGMVAAAMGVRRGDDESLKRLSSLRMGVRVDREGVSIVDYHTAHVPGAKHPTQTHRHYLSDASFTVGLESEDKELLQNIRDALSRPAFALYLGRRSCPPDDDVYIGEVDGELEDALKRDTAPGVIRYVFESKSGERGNLLRDQPVSFNPEHRRFAFRQAREEFVASENKTDDLSDLQIAVPEHDPLAELE